MQFAWIIRLSALARHVAIVAAGVCLLSVAACKSNDSRPPADQGSPLPSPQIAQSDQSTPQAPAPPQTPPASSGTGGRTSGPRSGLPAVSDHSHEKGRWIKTPWGSRFWLCDGCTPKLSPPAGWNNKPPARPPRVGVVASAGFGSGLVALPVPAIISVPVIAPPKVSSPPPPRTVSLGDLGRSSSQMPKRTTYDFEDDVVEGDLARPGPSAQPSPPPPIERYPSIEAPDTVALGQEIAVQVSLTSEQIAPETKIEIGRAHV